MEVRAVPEAISCYNRSSFQLLTRPASPCTCPSVLAALRPPGATGTFSNLDELLKPPGGAAASSSHDLWSILKLTWPLYTHLQQQ